MKITKAIMAYPLIEKSKELLTEPAKAGSVQRRVRHRGRWTAGYPKMIGHYDCKLEDGRIEIIKYFPGGDSEIHPYMEILNVGIVAHRRIPGVKYRSIHDV